MSCDLNAHAYDKIILFCVLYVRPTGRFLGIKIEDILEKDRKLLLQLMA